MNRGAAAAATWIFRGDESRRGRNRDVDIPRRRVAAPPAIQRRERSAALRRSWPRRRRPRKIRVAAAAAPPSEGSASRPRRRRPRKVPRRGRLRRRRARYPDGEGEYVYWIREADLYLDAGPSTHFTRYINHSKRAPSLETRVEFVKVVDREEVLADGLTPGVGFWTLKDIPVGDELTFDYGGDYFGDDEEIGVTEDTIYPPE